MMAKGTIVKPVNSAPQADKMRTQMQTKPGTTGTPPATQTPTNGGAA